MKRRIGILLGLALVLICAFAFADVEINETNFPDANFRQYIQNAGFDTDGDGTLSDEELAQVTEISCSEMSISSLAGIEYFTDLTELWCEDNQLTSLDVSRNTSLKVLWCGNNQLATLDVSKNMSLDQLACSFNRLTSLDMSKNTKLIQLYCSFNQLASLDISKCTALRELQCDENQITSLDVSRNTALDSLHCSCNQLTSLDLSNNTALDLLYCGSNQLTNLDISKNTALGDLQCNSNQLTSLDLSNNTAMTHLWCCYNQLTSLDVSRNTALEFLQCNANRLTSLDVSNCSALKALVENNERVISDNSYHYWSTDSAELYVDPSVTVTAGSFVSQGTEEESEPTDEPVHALKGHVIIPQEDGIPMAEAVSLLAKYKIIEQNEDGTFSCPPMLMDKYPLSVTMIPVTDANALYSIYFASGTPVITAYYTDDLALYVDEAAAAIGPIVEDGHGLGIYVSRLEGMPDSLSISDLQDMLGVSGTIEVETGLKIDETNFPDENFRSLVGNADTNRDGVLSDDEIAAVTEFSSGGLPVTSLQGIEYFTALEELSCFENQLTALDISKNTALKRLYCYDNQLTELDVSKNTALVVINCSSNQLASLDVSKNMALTSLGCESNQLTSLDVSSNTALEKLYCGSNPLTSLDISKNTALTHFGCGSPQLKTLDISKNTGLISLSVNHTKLTKLDVSKNTALKWLYCSYNQFTTLDISKNTKLEGITCMNNQLTSLDVSKNTALIEIVCISNQLTALDVSNNKALTFLLCQDNKLKTLDVSKISSLASLVKETDPAEADGVLTWRKDDDGDGLSDRSLSVDKGVDVIAEKIKQIDISKAKVTAIKAQVYTGKAIKPAVVIKYDGKKLTKDKDYTLSYKNNKQIGKATVTITGKGNYTGKKTVKFDIIPKAVKLSSLTAGKKELTVKWSKGSGITGYEIEYSLKKDFKTKKSVVIKKAATTKTVLKKLQAKKTYYVRIRAYKTVGGKKYYSAWSAIKNKKTK